MMTVSITNTSIHSSLTTLVNGNTVDPCLVGFTLEEYSVIESAGSVDVCVYLTCPPNKTNNVTVEVYSNYPRSPHARKSFHNTKISTCT